MRHRVRNKKLGRSTAHRQAMLAALVCGLIDSKRIKTTLAKAKLARGLAERMVTLGKKGTLAARRRAISKLRAEGSVATLFNEIGAGMFADREGGYTRILKLGCRRSDGSEMAILEWVTEPVEKKSPAVEK
jgi:large subunit ribosomal protein L17